MLVASFKNHTMQEGQKFEGKNNQCTGTIIKETCVGAFIRETQVPIAQKLYDSQRTYLCIFSYVSRKIPRLQKWLRQTKIFYCNIA